MKSLSKKILSFLLVFSLALGCVPFPMGIFAESPANESDIYYEKTYDYLNNGVYVETPTDGKKMAQKFYSSYGIIDEQGVSSLQDVYAIEPHWSTISRYYNGTTDFVKPYVVYRTTPKTAFKVNVRYDSVAKTLMENAGYDYDIKIYVSKDCKNWVPTGYFYDETTDVSMNISGEDYEMIRTSATVLNIGDDGYYVKVEFPLNGQEKYVLGGKYGNRSVAIEGVSFTPSMSENRCFKDGTVYDDSVTMASIGIIESNLVSILKNTGINVDYVKTYNKESFSNPYAIFGVKTNTPFKMKVTRNKTYEAKIASTLDTEQNYFMTKVYTSSDLVDWTEQVYTVENDDGAVVADYDFFLNDGAKYVKVVFPHTGSMKLLYPDVFSGVVGNDFLNITFANYTLTSYGEDYVTYDYTDTQDVPLSGAGENAIRTAEHYKALGAYDATIWGKESYEYGLLRNAGSEYELQMGYMYTSQGVPAYVTYNVEGNAEFCATVRIDASRKAEYEASDRNCEFKLLASDDNIVWNEIASSGKQTGIFDISAVVPESAKFVRIVFPQKGKLSDSVRGNDIAGIRKVTFVSQKADTNSYDYSDIEAFPFTNAGDNKRAIRYAQHYIDLGACDAALGENNDWYYGFLRTEQGYIQASYGYLSRGNGSPYITYNVFGAEEFKATFNINSSMKTNWEAISDYAGLTFEFKIYAMRDGYDWELVGSTGTNSGDFSVAVSLPEKTKYVKIVFPQLGKNSSGKMFNDAASLKAVSYNIEFVPYAGVVNDIYDVNAKYGNSVSAFGNVHLMASTVSIDDKFDTLFDGSNSKVTFSSNDAQNVRMIGTLEDGEFNALVLGFDREDIKFNIYVSNNNENIFADENIVLSTESVKGEKLYLLSENAYGKYVGIEILDVTEVAISEIVALKQHSITAGDFDGDNKFTANDLVMIKKLLLGIESFDVRISDINGQDGLNILDFIRLKKFLA